MTRTCQNCGQPFTQRESETTYNFNRRAFCGARCRTWAARQALGMDTKRARKQVTGPRYATEAEFIAARGVTKCEPGYAMGTATFPNYHQPTPRGPR